MKSRLLALMFLAGSTLFAGPRVFFGVGVGPVYGGYYPPPPPPPVYSYYAPPVPGPGYAWVGGSWYPAGPRWAWRGGYWARPPYAGAYWVGPRYYGGHYYAGSWRRR